MYFSDIGDSELSLFHQSIRNNFNMVLGDVLESGLFRVESEADGDLFKVFPLFYCDGIESTNPSDRVFGNRYVLCVNRDDTILTFSSRGDGADSLFGFSVFVGGYGVSVYVYDRVSQKPLPDVELVITTAGKVFNAVTGSDGAYCYNNVYGEVLSIVVDGVVVYSEPDNRIRYNGNLLLTSVQSTGNLTGTDIVLEFDDGTTVPYVSKSSFNHGMGDGTHELYITGNLTSLELNCFSNCTGLVSVNLPESVTSLGNYCFYNCTGLVSVNLPESVTSLGNHCFRGCTGLNSITLPDSLTSLGDNCFNGCTGLTSITIPETVTSLGSNCFSNCTGLTTINIPESVTSIGNYCFRYCSNLETINLNWTTDIPTFNVYWTYNTPSSLKFTIPNGTLQSYLNKGYPQDKLIERSQ